MGAGHYAFYLPGVSFYPLQVSARSALCLTQGGPKGPLGPHPGPPPWVPWDPRRRAPADQQKIKNKLKYVACNLGATNVGWWAGDVRAAARFSIKEGKAEREGSQIQEGIKEGQEGSWSSGLARRPRLGGGSLRAFRHAMPG